MGAFLQYFRLHRWQRRMTTYSLTVIVGVVALWFAWDPLYDRLLIARLGSSDPNQRNGAIRLAAARGKLSAKRAGLVRRLNDALGDAGDEQFSAVAEVLNRLGEFHTPDRPGEQFDRYCVINLAAAGDDETGVRSRLVWLNKLVLSGRDNSPVHRAVALASGDASAEVRAASSALAARLGDDEVLAKLLHDDEGAVRAVAAIGAGLAGRKARVATIAAMFEQPQADSDRAAAAYALARLAPKKFGKDIAQAVVDACQAGKTDLLEKLLVSAALLEAEVAGPAVAAVLDHCRKDGKLPPATALVAAGKLALAPARKPLAAVVDDLLTRGDDITVGETVVLAAAMRAGHRLKMPPGFFTRPMQKFWDPRIATAMILAAEALGDLATPGDAKTIALLAAAAGGRRAPVASAAAAVAVFKLAPDAAEDHLRAACDASTALAGDYVAWHLPRAGRREYAQLVTAKFFGPAVYSDGVRSAGALLLAFLARDTPEAARARELIDLRLAGGRPGRERDPVVIGSYQCALLILGREAMAEPLTYLKATDVFPKRRVLVALTVAGRAEGFEHVLARARFHPDVVDAYLAGRLMARVYAAVAPQLPAVDIDAPAAVRYWQARICREYYLIHRRGILEGLRK